ncbi:MAG: hypothetical protein IT334_06140 [Thermomicrobiales bacterium]|nr:hypothetical protein [Thermomicrobiales bacterium]
MAEPVAEIDETTTETPPKSDGALRIGPLVFSAKFSIILIYVLILGFNFLLFVGVVLAALYRAGRL